jgi:integrase
VSDLKSLKWGDIEHTNSGAEIVKSQVKTKEQVSVPLHASAWALINDKAIHNHNEPIFPLLAKSNTDTNKYLLPSIQPADLRSVSVKNGSAKRVQTEDITVGDWLEKFTAIETSPRSGKGKIRHARRLPEC